MWTRVTFFLALVAFAALPVGQLAQDNQKKPVVTSWLETKEEKVPDGRTWKWTEKCYSDSRPAVRHGARIGLSSRGTLIEEVWFYEDKWHGPRRLWDMDSGRMTCDTQYVEGKPEGVQRNWWNNGKPQSDFYYHNNLLEGRATDWYENGNKERDGTYKEGKKEGVWTSWYENGQKSIEGTYESDKKVGTWTEWTKEGEVVSITEYKKTVGPKKD